MDTDQAFDTLQTNVNAELDMVKEARRRRNLFIGAFETLDASNAASLRLARSREPDDRIREWTPTSSSMPHNTRVGAPRLVGTGRYRLHAGEGARVARRRRDRSTRPSASQRRTTMR